METQDVGWHNVPGLMRMCPKEGPIPMITYSICKYSRPIPSPSPYPSDVTLLIYYWDFSIRSKDTGIIALFMCPIKSGVLCTVYI